AGLTPELISQWEARVRITQELEFLDAELAALGLAGDEPTTAEALEAQRVLRAQLQAIELDMARLRQDIASHPAKTDPALLATGASADDVVGTLEHLKQYLAELEWVPRYLDDAHRYEEA